ncbi:MAG: hypothetical protein BJ554DRAFT_693 [Olpidium bornovanus]|uniref:Uncharacterized protein n=1 Tax=Olpidium bornovanus TaxID=278681 RepID=A0A8H8A1F5_9FUNG|nr:MAG: hypothetical protein BJ554DRAFT_693 [Olpidium bornovanus]
MTADRNRLDARSNHLAVENEGLKEKVREFAEANTEITESHQELQRQLDIRTTELEESAAQLEQTKAQYQTTLRSKKQLQADFNVVVKQKQELTEKSKVTETLVARKEKDISDLLTKVNDTIREYEAKIHAKDEEIWAMAALSEGGVPHRDYFFVFARFRFPFKREGRPAGRVSAAGRQITDDALRPETEKQKQGNAIDPGMLQDMEKQFSQKEKGLVGEIEHLNKMLSGALERVSGCDSFPAHADVSRASVLSAQNEKLKAYQFEPRMERLKMIEKDVRTKMEEYSVAEETLEVGASSFSPTPSQSSRAAARTAGSAWSRRERRTSTRPDASRAGGADVPERGYRQPLRAVQEEEDAGNQFSGVAQDIPAV